MLGDEEGTTVTVISHRKEQPLLWTQATAEMACVPMDRDGMETTLHHSFADCSRGDLETEDSRVVEYQNLGKAYVLKGCHREV